jgi:DNA-binding MarR family transcriptional regulator
VTTPEQAFDVRYADLAEIVLTVAREIVMRETDVPDAVSLTPSNAQVMRYIDSHPGAMPSEAAEATGLLRSNLSTAIRELEKIGFIEKRRDPDDGRGIRLFSTAEAARNLEVIRAQWSDGAARALGGPSGVEDATKMLRKLADGLVEDRRQAGLRWKREQL